MNEYLVTKEKKRCGPILGVLSALLTLMRVCPLPAATIPSVSNDPQPGPQRAPIDRTFEHFGILAAPTMVSMPSLELRSCPDASRIAIEFRDGRRRAVGSRTRSHHRGLSEPVARAVVDFAPSRDLPCWSIERDCKVGLDRIDLSIGWPGRVTGSIDRLLSCCLLGIDSLSTLNSPHTRVRTHFDRARRNPTQAMTSPRLLLALLLLVLAAPPTVAKPRARKQPPQKIDQDVPPPPHGYQTPIPAKCPEFMTTSGLTNDMGLLAEAVCRPCLMCQGRGWLIYPPPYDCTMGRQVSWDAGDAVGVCDTWKHVRVSGAPVGFC